MSPEMGRYTLEDDNAIMAAHTAVVAAHHAPGLGRGTVTIAAVDSLALSIARADYVCDGVDDEVQINAAIVALMVAGGGQLDLCEGTFNIQTNPITATWTGDSQVVDIVGRGWRTILNNTNVAGMNTIEIDGTAGHFRGGRIASLRFTSNAAAGVSIYLYRTFLFKVFDVSIGGAIGTHGTHGVECNNTYMTFIDHCSFQLLGGRGVYTHGSPTSTSISWNIFNGFGAEAIYLDGDPNTYIAFNNFESAAALENTFIYYNGTIYEGWVLNNSFITDASWTVNTPLINIVGDNTNYANDMNIVGNKALTGKKKCILQTNQYCRRFNVAYNFYAGMGGGATGFYLSGISFNVHDNHSDTCSDYMFDLSNADAFNIHHNYALGARDGLVFAANTCTDLVIDSNINEWTSVAFGGVCGLDIDAPGTQVSNNRIIGNATEGWAKGININADDCVVSGNFIKYATDGIYGEDGDDVMCKENRCILCDDPIDINRAACVRWQVMGNNTEGNTNDINSAGATNPRVTSNIDKAGAWLAGDDPG
ncbi:MAG: hypothetical protein HWN68_10955 [Desulfobacterales bacterium]|nr:hypothetical protein [Desulfobacterales bacterium]